MIFYLRTKEGDNLYEVEITRTSDEKVKDINASVYIKEYSYFLLSQSHQKGCIKVFDFLSDIRRWYFEDFIYTTKNYYVVRSEIKKTLGKVAAAYNLYVVED